MVAVVEQRTIVWVDDNFDTIVRRQNDVMLGSSRSRSRSRSSSLRGVVGSGGGQCGGRNGMTTTLGLIVAAGLMMTTVGGGGSDRGTTRVHGQA
jgi:hypothetical protein